MIRFLSAIGMSQYCEPQKLEELIRTQLADPDCELRTYLRKDSGCLQFELMKNMGPFGLNIIGLKVNKETVTGFFPMVRELRGDRYRECEIKEERPGCFYMNGLEEVSGEGVKMLLTSGFGLFDHGELRARQEWRYSRYGLSVAGKILLGVERDEEELEAMDEEEMWRRDLLNRALQGDEDAIEEAEDFAESTEEEIRDRLRFEDIYTILDGFFMQRGSLNQYSMLGEIQYVDKMMNPKTEEWVYRLQVKILGTSLGVYINPKDLVGQPAKGRRFQGEILLQGMACPELLLLDKNRGFF